MKLIMVLMMFWMSWEHLFYGEDICSCVLQTPVLDANICPGDTHTSVLAVLSVLRTPENTGPSVLYVLGDTRGHADTWPRTIIRTVLVSSTPSILH
jgi:hypothetical protein